MKKIVLLGLTIFSLIGCRKDNQEEKEPTLEGKWVIKKTMIIDGADGLVLKTKNREGCSANDYYEFSSDKKSQKIEYIQNYTKEGNIGDCEILNESKGIYTYNTSSKRLYINFEIILGNIVSYNFEDYQVNKLTTNELHLKFNNPTEDINTDNIPDYKVIVLEKL